MDLPVHKVFPEPHDLVKTQAVAEKLTKLKGQEFTNYLTAFPIIVMAVN